MNEQKHFLVIEDDPHLHEVLEVKAQKLGLVFSFARDGEEGISSLRSGNPYAAVLLDIRMPNKDGLWFLEEKQKDPALQGIPVLVFSNISARDFVERALAYGVKGYLVKANHSIDQVIEELNACAGGNTCTIDPYY